MDIEKELFKKEKIRFDSLEEYGFLKDKDIYIYSKKILKDEFEVKVKVDLDANIESYVIDLDTNEEYLTVKTNSQGEFVNKVREAYLDVLNDIKDKCFTNKDFITDQANRVSKYIFDKYNSHPCFLWSENPGFGVFKNEKNKWYGIIMNINISKLTKGEYEVEVMNLKVSKEELPKLLEKENYYEAYHMNKKHWVSIVLDGKVDDKEIFKLIDESYDMVLNSK